jgi:subtilisin family serine protease
MLFNYKTRRYQRLTVSILEAVDTKMKLSSFSFLVSSFLLLSSHLNFDEGGKKETNEKGKRNRINNRFLIGEKNDGGDVNDVSECDDVERDYIVVFKKKNNVFKKKNTSIKDDVKAEAEFLTKKVNGKLMKTYGFVLEGFSATLTCKGMNELHNNPDVAYIEEDGQVTVNNDCTNATQSSVPSWGLDRIDSAATQSTSKLDGTYSYVDDGSAQEEVQVYVIDTGIKSFHDEFAGRLGKGFNAVANTETHPGSWEDCNGHGTHVAGTIGGKQYGVAKNANIILHTVRVLDCKGSGYTSDILEAYDWVIAQCTNTTRICVANGSFGGGVRQASNDGATSMVEAGIVYVVSAGNDSGGACQKSPASAAGVITVGSTTIYNHLLDARSLFSNYGECVDVFAPVRAHTWWASFVLKMFRLIHHSLTL